MGTPWQTKGPPGRPKAPPGRPRGAPSVMPGGPPLRPRGPPSVRPRGPLSGQWGLHKVKGDSLASQGSPGRPKAPPCRPRGAPSLWLEGPPLRPRGSPRMHACQGVPSVMPKGGPVSQGAPLACQGGTTLGNPLSGQEVPLSGQGDPQKAKWGPLAG